MIHEFPGCEAYHNNLQNVLKHSAFGNWPIRVQMRNNWPGYEKLHPYYANYHPMSIRSIETSTEEYWDYLDEKNSPKVRPIVLITIDTLPIGG